MYCDFRMRLISGNLPAFTVTKYNFYYITAAVSCPAIYAMVSGALLWYTRVVIKRFRRVGHRVEFRVLPSSSTLGKSHFVEAHCLDLGFRVATILGYKG